MDTTTNIVQQPATDAGPTTQITDTHQRAIDNKGPYVIDSLGRRNRSHPPRKLKKWRSPVRMLHRVEKYFKQDGLKSIYGLAMYLGFRDDQSLLDYERYGDAYSGVIARARALMREYYDKLGQGSKSGYFADRMLTRMGRPSAVPFGGAGSDGPAGVVVLVFGQPHPQAVKQVESKTVEALPAGVEPKT